MTWLSLSVNAKDDASDDQRAQMFRKEGVKPVGLVLLKAESNLDVQSALPC